LHQPATKEDAHEVQADAVIAGMRALHEATSARLAAFGEVKIKCPPEGGAGGAKIIVFWGRLSDTAPEQHWEY
jgi:hypothetical protein